MKKLISLMQTCMVEDLILRMEWMNVMKQESVRTLSEGNKRPWEAWKAKTRGTGVRWESESGAQDFLFIMVDDNVVV